MAMELTGLDIAIRRMQSIERQFQELSGVSMQNADSDFQKILESSMASKSQNSDTDKIFSPNASHNVSRINNEEVEELIDKYASNNNLDADFVKAVVKQESGFNSNAKSHCGAMGLMQLMPATASSLGVQNAFDPEQNIAGGTKYLKGLMDRYNCNKELALAAYNAGPGAVNKYGGVPPYKETQNYVKNILSSYKAYKGDAI